MHPQIGNTIFIIWRESVEALLVIGILNAWLQQQTSSTNFVRARRYLWSGVLAGLVLATVFAAALILFGESLPEDAQQIYQTAAVLIAAGLIVQMVVWMRRNGRNLRHHLENALGSAVDRANWWSVFVLALVAVLREASETAIFLYGTLQSTTKTSVVADAASILLGFGAAGATYWVLQAGSKAVSWRAFFRVTEIMLLLLAGSLVMLGVDNLVDLGVLPSLSHLTRRVWDSSAILSDGGPIGGLVSALTGYRAKPILLEVVTYAAYWVFVLWLLSFTRQPRRPV